jgi:glutamine amidotransferase-like uncharacterized protein
MKPRIALFIHDPEASRECADAMIEVLSGEFQITTFNEEEFDYALKDSDIVAFGGGIGDAQKYYDFFKRREGNAVADFVSSGGKYLGICMGAYWAGRNYFDLLTDIEPTQYIKRPFADVKRSFATVAQVEWGDIETKMFFYDGCTFEGNGRAQLIARYYNGDPMAIIQGRVGLIGCHPESQEKWYNKKYLKKHWHGGVHHELLLSFTKKLMRVK